MALTKEELLEQKKEYLRSRGWHDWYHPDYWVHPIHTKPLKECDYTNYGHTVDFAYERQMEIAREEIMRR